MKHTALALCLLVCGCVHAPVIPAPDAAESRHLVAIEAALPQSDAADAPPQRVEERLHHWNVPAVSVAVFGEGRIRWAKAWGVADADTEQSVSALTRFQAGSISKPLTAAAILQAVEEGRLDLNRDINEALRTWKVPDHDWSAIAPVTAGALISHTAGVSVRSFPGYAIDSPLPTLEQILTGSPPASTPPIVVAARPGAAYGYSGGGYVILQRCLIDLDGQSFEILMGRRLLEPLGMTRSTFALLKPDDAPDLASGHTPAGRRVAGGWHLYPESAAAGLWATPSDLARFAMAVQRALDAPDQPQAAVSAQSARWMISPSTAPTQGMAFDLSPSSFYHAGDTEGFYAALVASRDGHMGVAVMTNGANGGHLINEVLQAVEREYRWNS